MALKNRMAKLLIDPAFRNPGMLKFIFSIDDFTGIDLVKTLAPFKLMPASRALFTRCFAHFVSGEEISLAASTGLARLAPNRAAHDYLLLQAGEERVHLEHFRDKLSQFGLGDAELSRHLAPSFAAFGKAIAERVEAGDYAAGIVGNNIVVEGLAICMLEMGCSEMRANSDEITKFMDFVLDDERHHVRFGERMLKRLNENGRLDHAAAEDFYGIMWGLARKAIYEIPDVLDAMSLTPATLEAGVKQFYDNKFAAAGLTFAVE